MYFIISLHKKKKKTDIKYPPNWYFNRKIDVHMFCNIEQRTEYYDMRTKFWTVNRNGLLFVVDVQCACSIWSHNLWHTNLHQATIHLSNQHLTVPKSQKRKVCVHHVSSCALRFVNFIGIERLNLNLFLRK